MLTSISSYNKKSSMNSVQPQSAIKSKFSNVLPFKSSASINNEKRNKAILEIKRRATKLHW